MRWYIVPSTALLLIPGCRSEHDSRALGEERPARAPEQQGVSDPLEQRSPGGLGVRSPGEADVAGPETAPPPAGGALEHGGTVVPPSEYPAGMSPHSGDAGVTGDEPGQRGIPYQGQPGGRQPAPRGEPQQQGADPQR